MTKITFKSLLITALMLTSFMALSAEASTAEQEAPKKIHWPFDGIRGKFDRQAIQRGFQVYKEVCAACHSMNLVSYRNLEAVGFSKAEIKALASEYRVMDGPNDAGEMFERPARPSDRFVPAYPNENAARAANNGAYPPDLSLMVKARADGANYVYSLLTGYGKTPPAGFSINTGMYYNPYFPGRQIAMPAPLSDGMVTYIDGTQATVDQMSRDVVQFLQWAAEPEMEQRKRMGLKILMYLGVFTVMFYLAKRKIWSNLK